MHTTQTLPPIRRQPNAVPFTVAATEVQDCGRIMTDYGEGDAWGAQPAFVAELRHNHARSSSGLPRRVLALLLFNGKAQRLADFIDSRRRAKLGQSRASDIPTLIVQETVRESEENVLEARILAGQADRMEKARCAETMREHARDLLALVEALHDDVHGAAV